MRLFILLISLVVLSSCASVSIDKRADGTCTVRYSSLFKDLSGVSVEACGAKSSFNSGVNTATVDAISKALDARLSH